MIQFILNDKVIKTNLSKGSTLLDFVRYEQHLVGTKIGCREGDCGACGVLIGDIQNDDLVYRSMTSCITPLGNVQGKHVITIEGVNGPQLSAVQELMVNNNGTQCGFCTPGFIMSMVGYTLSDTEPTLENAIKFVDGNICRCTGYKSIERALNGLNHKLKDRPHQSKTKWLVENGYLPNYFINIKPKLIKLRQSLIKEISYNSHPDHYVLGGGTDLLVQEPEVIKNAPVKIKFDENPLNGIDIVGNICRIGASATVTDLLESKKFRNIFPNLDKYLKLVSSTPIRNMATIGGNIVNASPIGDMTIFFLALDSSINLISEESRRTIRLKDFFLDYKKLDKTVSEVIETIEFVIPKDDVRFNFEKVSKRTHLDIASVNTACLLSFDQEDTITNAHISAGGVAPIPKYLSKASAYLINKKLDINVLNGFFQIVNSEIAPISDTRGSEKYKKLLLRQLLIAHFVEIFGITPAISKFFAS